MADDVEPVGAELVAELVKLGSFGVLVGDDVVRIDELSALELAAVQRQSGVGWLDLMRAPTADLLGALALVEVCEAHAGVTPTGGHVTVAELLGRVVRMAPTLEVVGEAHPAAR